MADLKIKKVSKIYENGFHGVKNFNIDIIDKEFIVIVGSSGCGKTSMLRMIAGLEKITDGQIYMDGLFLNNVEAKDRDIAMVFQNYALYPHMTVYDNIAFPLKINKCCKCEIDKKVKNVSEILEISSLLHQKPNTLSGGQQQRVALGRAIVREPKIFLMDEPLSNLDTKLRGQMRTVIKKLHKKLGATFIYVTHDQTEAMTMASRIVVMEKGEIQQIGTPQEAYDEPNNLFVAKLIGNPMINVVEGIVVKQNESIQLKIDAKQCNQQTAKYIQIAQDKQNILKRDNYINERVKIGIRSEDIIETEEKGSSIIESFIEIVENMGSEVYLYFKIDDEICTAISKRKKNYRIGDPFSFYLIGSKIHIFDYRTEERIM